MKKPIIGILYDFDKTLCTDDMQAYDLIPSFGMTPDEFWGLTQEFTDKYGVERILSYMYVMVKTAENKGIALTREYLNKMGENIKFFRGVRNWFKRINEYGEELGVKVEHYLVSSGNKEIIDGCEIADEFVATFACEFYYSPDTGLPVWPKTVINYTAKTQYFFRISKGALDTTDDETVNKKVEDRRIPYRNIIYLGDGVTDIPIMILAKDNGGKAIAVYQESNHDLVRKLYEDERVNFICKADYSSGGELDKIVKLIIQEIAVSHQLSKKQEKMSQ